jgi:DNA-binding transcriptional LysR family regulator
MIILRDFPALLAVADELHFGRAALRLGVSQPQLTAEGEALVAAARRALREAESGIAQARAIADGLAGMVRFGFAPVSILSGLAPVLAEFRAGHADVLLQLVERHSAHLWQDLEEGRLDLIVARETDTRSGLRSVEIIRDPLVLALPADHPLAARTAISLADLQGDPFVFWARDSAPQYHDLVMSACQEAGLVPNVSQIVNGWSAIVTLVANGFGVALVSAPLARIGFPGLCFRPIVEPMPEASFWLSWDPARESAAAGRLRDVILARCGGGLPAPLP